MESKKVNKTSMKKSPPPPITWSLKQVNASEVKPNPNNPKKQNAKGLSRLKKSLKKFGTVFDGICNADLTLIDGHSRLQESGSQILKVFVPSRQLTEKEYLEMNAIFDAAKAGDLDNAILEETFEDDFFQEWEIDKSAKPEITETELRPYTKTHVLISFPPEKMLQLQPLLEQIIKTEGVEYEQSNN